MMMIGRSYQDKFQARFSREFLTLVMFQPLFAVFVFADLLYAKTVMMMMMMIHFDVVMTDVHARDFAMLYVHLYQLQIDYV